MLLAELTLQHPILLETLGRVPDIEVVWQETQRHEDRPTQMLCWILSDDFDAVEDAMADDPSVGDSTVVAVLDGRRLYRVDFTDRSANTDLTPQLVAVGAVVDEAVGTAEGWWLRLQFPDRDAVESVYEFCRDHDIAISVERLYEQTDWELQQAPALTDSQRELLCQALESGYLEIPRRCSLAELAAELGISESAASERFRRGVRGLLEQTLDT
jgi:predicted DNA binding protein